MRNISQGSLEMASAEQIKALLKSHIDGDDSHFLSVAMQVAAHEAKLGHGKLAIEIRSLVDAAKVNKSLAYSKSPIPISRPKGELSQILEVIHPKLHISDMVLSQAIEKRLSRVVREQRNFDKIRSHGLFPRRKLLLVGPPGTGKSMTASVLAGELISPF